LERVTLLAFYRTVYVLLGALLGAAAGYLFAKYSVLLFGIVLHFCFPKHYSFENIMAVVIGTRSWLRPLVAVGCGAYAALTCYRFSRARAHSS
jgi:hypothetical protein